KNIVLTTDADLQIEGVDVINDPLMAFDIALEHDDSDEGELVVIGGAEVYKLYLPYAHKIYLTEVDYHGEADAFFPKFDKNEWNTVETTEFEKFNFKILERAN
ncbi:MAG: dihydrofolate reductase, partial [Alphaproteobacteria bacterium]